MTRGRRCLPGILWPARRVFKPWCCWRSGTSLASATAATAPTALSLTNPARMPLAAMPWAMGGVFGRVDAIYGSLECQKSGAEHIHLQAFVQCFHQFFSLSELQG